MHLLLSCLNVPISVGTSVADFYQYAQSVTENTAIQHFKVIAKELKSRFYQSVSTKRMAMSSAWILLQSMMQMENCLEFIIKTHIPDDHYYQEKFYFTPGNTGFSRSGILHMPNWVTNLCWDQWFLNNPLPCGAEIALLSNSYWVGADLDTDSCGRGGITMQTQHVCRLSPSKKSLLEEVTPCEMGTKFQS